MDLSVEAATAVTCAQISGWKMDEQMDESEIYLSII